MPARRAFAPFVDVRGRRCGKALSLAAAAAAVFGVNAAVAQDVMPKIKDGAGIVDDALVPIDGLPPMLAQQFCAIVVANPGVMVASIDMHALSSDVIGGRTGRASIVTTNASHSAVLDSPQGFLTMPASNVPPTVFSGTMRGSGATSFANQAAGQPVRLKRGATEIDVSLTASAQGGTYPAGHYATEAILRCE